MLLKVSIMISKQPIIRIFRVFNFSEDVVLPVQDMLPFSRYKTSYKGGMLGLVSI